MQAMTAGEISEEAAALAGGRLSGFAMLSGGDLSAVCEVTLEDGRAFVAKTGPSPRAEARMLEAIRKAGVSAPAPLSVSDRVLVIERLAPGGSLSGVWGELGLDVARLHAAVSPDGLYGWAEDYAFADVLIENGFLREWPEFWVARRLAPSLSALPVDLARRLETLCRSIEDLLPALPRASLLHGDLWAGNVFVTAANAPVLIDPACYYGHGEVDIAMLELFATPSPAFYEVYGPLDPGSRERRAVYSLWPALVHFRLFGAGYEGMIDNFLEEAGF